MNYEKLTEIQLDALRELGNIGTGNAATALSQMIQKRIDMTIPQVDILPVEQFVSKIGSLEEKVVAVVLRILGDAPGNVVFLLTMDSALKIVKMLTGEEVSEELSEFQMSSLQEMGNILTGAYMNSIVKLTGLMMISSVPAISIDMLLSVMNTLLVESEQFECNMISLEAKFIEGDQDINGYYFYIPKPGSLEKLMQSLGIL